MKSQPPQGLKPVLYACYAALKGRSSTVVCASDFES